MKLKIQKEDFTRALQSVQKVASNKSNNLSSENGLLIKAINDNIEIQANDYDMGIKTTVPGIIEESGEVFLWDPHLSELTRRIASEEIILTKSDSDSQMSIEGGKLKYRYMTMNTEDFNEVEVVEQGYISPRVYRYFFRCFRKILIYGCNGYPSFGFKISYIGSTVNRRYSSYYSR